MKQITFTSSLIIISTILFYKLSFSQSYDLTGTWKGGLGQDDKSWPFDMTLNLKQVQNTISGTAKYVTNDGSGVYVIQNITGEVNGNFIILNDITVSEENSVSSYWYWCKKNYLGKIIITSDSIILLGEWKNEGSRMFRKKQLVENTGGYCYPGNFRVAKKQSLKLESPITIDKPKNLKSDSVFLDRKVNVKKTYEIISDSVQLSFYDNGQIDNDTISVYFNRALLLNHQRLSGRAIKITISILPNIDNELLMYANNLGTIPPNTALLTFNDSGARHEITIDSNTKESGTIVLRKKQN